MLKTRITDLLGIEHPVLLAGMGGVSYHELVAAVSSAGGFGCIGASTLSATDLRDEIGAVKSSTDRPFGVDLLVPPGGTDISDRIDVLVSEGVAVFVSGLGVPHEFIGPCHDRGVLVATVCGKVMHAVRAAEAGCDFVIAQGTEAGGHTGTVATMPLVAQVVDAIGDRVPVVAAGGISDGRGLAAALALGADGVWVGTRFIATPEAQTVRGYKETLLRTAEDGTVVTRAYSGKTTRVVRNERTRYYEEHPDELQPFPVQAARSAQEGVMHLGGDESTPGIDERVEFFPAGQGVGAVDEVVPAAELVRRFVSEAEDALDRASRLRGV
jgi:enoyl-[acyl-carrier protein] reductase II